MNLFNLVATIALDSSDYEKGLDKADKSASDFSKKSEKNFDKVQKAVKTTIKVIGAIAGAITTAAGAITALSTSTINFTGAVDDAAKQLQITTDQYQEWDWIMKQIGADSSSLDMAFRQIATVMSNVSEGNKDAIKSLQDLGIEYKSFGQLNASEQLDTLVAAFQRLENGTDKTRLAQEIFGNRVYQQLMPILNDAEGSVDSMKQEIRDLGLVMDSASISVGEKLGDKLEYMKGTVKQLAYNYGAELFPAVEMVVDGIIGLATGSEDADKSLESLSDGITGIVDKVIGDLPKFLDIASNFLIQLINGIVSKIPEMVPGLMTLVENLLFTVIDILPDLVGSAGDIIIALADGLLRLDWISLIVALLESLMEIVANKLPDFVYNAIDMFLSLFTTGRGLEMLGKIGIGIAQALVNGAIMGIESSVNMIIHAINLFTKGLSSIWTWALGENTAIPAIPDVEIPRVQFMKNGGMFDDLLKQSGNKGTVYAVGGEAGAEVVAQGSRGTGVTNVEQFEEAMTAALYRVFGRGVTLRVGDRDMRAYITDAQNVSLKSQGRKTLNTVTRY